VTGEVQRKAATTTLLILQTIAQEIRRQEILLRLKTSTTTSMNIRAIGARGVRVEVLAQRLTLEVGVLAARVVNADEVRLRVQRSFSRKEKAVRKARRKVPLMLMHLGQSLRRAKAKIKGSKGKAEAKVSQ
jgi:hypothetical protein